MTDFCYCKDAPDVERDTRPPDFSAVFALCPRGKMSRCLCHDNKVVKFPFDMTTLLTTCRPKRVSRKTQLIMMSIYVSKLPPNFSVNVKEIILQKS